MTRLSNNFVYLELSTDLQCSGKSILYSSVARKSKLHHLQDFDTTLLTEANIKNFVSLMQQKPVVATYLAFHENRTYSGSSFKQTSRKFEKVIAYKNELL